MRTLHGRLAVALLALLGSTGALFLVLCLWTAVGYLHEVNQRLHLDVAEHLADEVILIEDDRVNREGLDHIFHMMMVINPGIEIYLLDQEGKILAYSAPPGKVKADRVSLGPVRSMLEAPRPRLPFLGEDPRAPGASTPFSVARLGSPDETKGYLYVVLGGERYASVVQLLAGSHILMLSAAGLVGCIVLAALTGFIVFKLLTRRLRRLQGAMTTFEQSGFGAPLSWPRPHLPEDELDELALTFFRLSEAFAEQLERARVSDDLRRNLVANVSHDLRTPLATLTGLLETLLLKDETLDLEERRRYLDTAYRHSRSLGELVGRLFELAKLEARQTEAQLEPFVLGELVQDVALKFELAAAERGVRLEAHLPADLSPVLADLSLIERVLDNLIDNALRYTPSGGRVDLSTYPEPGGVVLEVRDTGEGFSEQDLPFVFDRFYRARGASTSCREKGSGLGLAIAQSIATLHGTRLEVESRRGLGTSFRLRLESASPDESGFATCQSP